MSLDILNNLKQTDNMIKYQKNRSIKNSNIILQILLELQEATPKQIENYLKEQNLDNIPMTLITIKRQLQQLEKEKLVISKKGIYQLSLTSKAKFGLLMYLHEINGESMIMSVGHFPLESIEQSFNELLIRFGSIILFSFIEGANLINKSENLQIDKEYFNSWLTKTIPIESMWKLFVTIYGNQEKTRKIESVNNLNDLNKVNFNKLNKLKEIFIKLYPEIYKELKISFSNSTNYSINYAKEDEVHRLKDYKKVIKLLKKGSDGREHIELKPDKLQNKVYGYISSKNWSKEIKELENNN